MQLFFFHIFSNTCILSSPSKSYLLPRVLSYWRTVRFREEEQSR